MLGGLFCYREALSSAQSHLTSCGYRAKAVPTAVIVASDANVQTRRHIKMLIFILTQ